MDRSSLWIQRSTCYRVFWCQLQLDRFYSSHSITRATLAAMEIAPLKMLTRILNHNLKLCHHCSDLYFQVQNAALARRKSGRLRFAWLIPLLPEVQLYGLTYMLQYSCRCLAASTPFSLAMMHLPRNYNKILVACPFSLHCKKRFGSLSAMAHHINSSICRFELTEVEVALLVQSFDVGNQLTTVTLPKAIRELMAKGGMMSASRDRSNAADLLPVAFHCPCLEHSFVCPKAFPCSFKSLAGLIEHLETSSCPGRVEALQFVAEILQSAIGSKIGSKISLKQYAHLANMNSLRQLSYPWWSADLGYPPWQGTFVPAANNYVPQGGRTSMSDLRLSANEMYSSFTSLRTVSRAMNAVPKLWCSLSILGYKAKNTGTHINSELFRLINPFANGVNVTNLNTILDEAGPGALGPYSLSVIFDV